jgi:hypothetical protein
MAYALFTPPHPRGGPAGALSANRRELAGREDFNANHPAFSQRPELSKFFCIKSIHAPPRRPHTPSAKQERVMGEFEAMREVNRQRYVLEHILALLLLMASLADRAAGLPLRRRRTVLEILACGETEARALVLGLATGSPACGGEVAPEPAPLDDAANLAAGLRVLALALGVLLAEARRVTLPGETGPRAGLSPRKPAGSVHPWREAPALPAPDTS